MIILDKYIRPFICFPPQWH